MNTILSRRGLLALAGGTLAAHARLRGAAFRQTPARPTVQDILALVQQRLGSVAPPATTVDGLKAGRLDQPVTGIVTAAMASIDVIRRAAAVGHNLVLTCEPTFFARADQPSPANRTADAVFAAKRALLDTRGIAVWRVRDQWLARRPDPMVHGLADALQWGRYQDAVAPHRIAFPVISLRELTGQVESRLGARAMRIVGDPDLRVTRVILSPGPSAPATTFAGLATTDVVLAGEPREWEGVEYVQDAIAAGQQKGMIIVGRVLSEEPGMKVMAQWLAGVVPAVPVEWMSLGDQYWRPAPR